MWNTIKYILMYLGMVFSFGLLSFFLADMSSRFAHRRSRYKRIDRITGLAFFFLVGVSLILPYFMLQSWFRIFPPFLKSDSPSNPAVNIPVVETQLEKENHRIAVAVQALKRAVKDPDNMTIKGMRKLMVETLEISETLQNRVDEQQRLISDLRRTSKMQEKRYLLSPDQIDAVKFVTSDAQDAATKMFIYGVALSFPIGVVSSLVADELKRIREKRRRRY